MVTNLNGFKARLTRFFSGRYGLDKLGYFLFIVYAILCIINAIFRNYFIQIITLALLFYSFMRVMSRNYVKRSAENRKFLALKSALTTELKLIRDRFKFRKTNRFRKCTHCRAIVMLPIKKGKHTVKCPKCGQRFDVKI